MLQCQENWTLAEKKGLWSCAISFTPLCFLPTHIWGIRVWFWLLVGFKIMQDLNRKIKLVWREAADCGTWGLGGNFGCFSLSAVDCQQQGMHLVYTVGRMLSTRQGSASWGILQKKWLGSRIKTASDHWKHWVCERAEATRMALPINSLFLWPSGKKR